MMQNGNDYFAEQLDRLCPMVMPDTDEGAFALIPSLAVLCDKLEELETLERQIQVRKQPQLLQEVEPAERGGTSHEHSFWMAWPHIARWREQEVDALKAALKQATFCHWRISTLERPNEAIICTCCEQWLCDRYWYEEHKASKKHKKNSRSRGMVMLMSAAAWVDDETWSTSSEIGSEPYPEP